MNHLWFSNFSKVVSLKAIEELKRYGITPLNANVKLIEESEGSQQVNSKQFGGNRESQEEDYKGWCELINSIKSDDRKDMQKKVWEHVVAPTPNWDPELPYVNCRRISKL